MYFCKPIVIIFFGWLLSHANFLYAQLSLTFSHQRGFYEQPFELQIVASTTEVVVYYTLDGTEPSATNGTVYEGSIQINTTTPVRARAYLTGVDTSKVYNHTFIFPDDVVNQTNPAGYPVVVRDYGTGKMIYDYEMNPDLVGSGKEFTATEISNALLSLPTVAFTTDKDAFFDPDDGIYPVEQKGEALTVGIEMLYPANPGWNWSSNCGISHHSNWHLAKESMRVKFKAVHGDRKLNKSFFRTAPHHAETAANEFDGIVFRGDNNGLWTKDSRYLKTAFMRDQWCHDTFIEMYGYGSRGMYVHVYINGLYFGVYNAQERTDEAFMEDYFGGVKEDWYAIGHSRIPEADPANWDTAMNPATYVDVQQNVDLVNFADYLHINWYASNWDWPQKNWWGSIRNLPEPGRARFFVWDLDLSFGNLDGSNPGKMGKSKYDNAVWKQVWEVAKDEADFKMLMADRVYKHCFNGGALDQEVAMARWKKLENTLREPMKAEVVRWGDNSYNANDSIAKSMARWDSALSYLYSTMENRAGRYIEYLRNETPKLYPDIDPPMYFSNTDTIQTISIAVDSGYQVKLENPNDSGKIYYTLDGTDPRMPGGAVNPQATSYSGETLTFNTSRLLLGRVKTGSEWSALHCLNIYTKQDLSALKVTEIMYHPPPYLDIPGTELEFIELKNTSADQSLDLSGVKFVDGIDFEFPIGTTLGPQQFVVLASNAQELPKKCPDAEIFGEYTGQLENSGERIAAITKSGDTLIAITYDDKAPWSQLADGLGFSLVPVESNPTGNQRTADQWKASSNNNCTSPGANDPSSSVGILSDVADENSINIYPNPSKGQFILEFQDVHSSEIQIRIFDVTGNEVYRQEQTLQSNGHHEVLDLSGFPSGCYFLKLEIGGQPAFISKLIKYGE